MRSVPHPFLTAEWRNLVVLNYRIDSAVLAPRVPPGLSISHHPDGCYVSVLAFQFLNTRLKGTKIPGHVNFPEVNLRFYAHPTSCVIPETGEVPESDKGVVFLQELVPKAMVAWTARFLYGEPYRTVALTGEVNDPHYRYHWQMKGKQYKIAAERTGDWYLPEEDGPENRMIAHFRRSGRTVAYSIERPPWRCATAVVTVSGDLSEVYGPEVGKYLRDPVSSFLADGSAIAVSHPEQLP